MFSQKSYWLELYHMTTPVTKVAGTVCLWQSEIDGPKCPLLIKIHLLRLGALSSQTKFQPVSKNHVTRSLS